MIANRLQSLTAIDTQKIHRHGQLIQNSTARLLQRLDLPEQIAGNYQINRFKKEGFSPRFSGKRQEIFSPVGFNYLGEGFQSDSSGLPLDVLPSAPIISPAPSPPEVQVNPSPTEEVFRVRRTARVSSVQLSETGEEAPQLVRLNPLSPPSQVGLKASTSENQTAQILPNVKSLDSPAPSLPVIRLSVLADQENPIAQDLPITVPSSPPNLPIVAHKSEVTVQREMNQTTSTVNTATPNPPPEPVAGNAADLTQIAEQVNRALRRSLAIERERRGLSQ